MRIPFASRRYNADVIVGGLAINSLALVLPVFMMQLYDRILPNNSAATLTWLAIAAILAIVVEAVIRTARNRWAAWHTEKALFTSRRQIIDSILATPAVSTQAREVFPALRLILNDSYQQLAFLFADIPFSVLYLALIFLIHPLLSLILLVAGLLLILVLRLLRPRYIRLKTEQDDLALRRERLMEATFEATAELKALGAEELVAQHHDVLQDEIAANEAAMAALETAKMALSKAIDAVSVFVPLIVGGIFVIQGHLTVGALTACILLARRTIGPMQRFAERWYQEGDLHLARQKVYRLARQAMGPALGAQAQEFPVEGPASLEINGIIVRKGIEAEVEAELALSDQAHELVGDDEVVLNVADRRLPPGSLVCFPSSAPNSVAELFQVIRGTNPYFSGEVRLGGALLSGFRRAVVGHRVVLLQETTILFPGTFLENLASFDPQLLEAAQKASATVGLDSFFEAMERGYETQVTPALVAGISSNVLQRIALARALTLDPAVLLLDRFDAALDHETRRQCRSVILGLRPGLVLFYRGDDEEYFRITDLYGLVTGDVLIFQKDAP